MSASMFLNPPVDGTVTDLGQAAHPYNNLVLAGDVKDPEGNVLTRYSNPDPSAITVGGIVAGTTFMDASIKDVLDLMLYPELFPTLTAPSSTFSLAQAGLREIGEVVTLGFSSGFSRGSISPAYGTSGSRSGLPNRYQYSGTGLPATVDSTSLTDTQSVSGYTVLLGVQTWGQIIAYDIGEQPLSSKGDDYSTPLAAGSTTQKTTTITGVYPAFGTTATIGVLTKQTLASMSSAYLQISMVAESGADKQTVDLPQEWSALTGIQFYNTVSSAWEWIGGSKAASLLTFTESSTTHTIQGNTITYDRFQHNGSTIGARQLRFYTT